AGGSPPAAAGLQASTRSPLERPSTGRKDAVPSTPLLRIAHVSDLHVLSPSGTELRRVLFNKRVTGYANLLLRRGRVYRREWLHAVMEAAAARADQLVVTGDIMNLSLEG